MGERIDDDSGVPPERRVEMLTRTSDGAGTIVVRRAATGAEGLGIRRQQDHLHDGAADRRDRRVEDDRPPGRPRHAHRARETRQGSLGLNGPTIASNFAEHRWQMQVIDVAMRHDKSLVQKRIGVAFFDPEQRGTRVARARSCGSG